MVSLDAPSFDTATKLRSPRRTQEERREDTRNRVLTATIDVLLTKGYSAFRIADVAATAGVSRGAQNHHFPTKDALIEAAIAKIFDTELDASKAAAAKAADDGILTEAALHAAEFLNSDQYYITSNMLVSAIENAQLVAKIQSISAQNRDPIEQAWIDRLQKIGLDPDVAEDVLWVLWSTLRDVAVRRRIFGNSSRNDRVIALALEMLSAYVAGRIRT